MAVAPPWGAQTASRARGSPPFGKILSSAPIPVATCSVVCDPPVSGVASGKRCSMRARSVAIEDRDIPSATTVFVSQRTGGRSYTEHIPKARNNPQISALIGCPGIFVIIVACAAWYWAGATVSPRSVLRHPVLRTGQSRLLERELQLLRSRELFLDRFR